MTRTRPPINNKLQKGGDLVRWPERRPEWNCRRLYISGSGSFSFGFIFGGRKKRGGDHMSIKVCKFCRKPFAIVNDGDPFGRIEDICDFCFDKKVEKAKGNHKQKEKPSLETEKPPKDGDQ
jgi:hypothetical protein